MMPLGYLLCSGIHPVADYDRLFGKKEILGGEYCNTYILRHYEWHLLH